MSRDGIVRSHSWGPTTDGVESDEHERGACVIGAVEHSPLAGTVSLSSTRHRGRWARGVSAEMVEDVGNHTGLGDDGNDTQFALATWAAAEVDAEHALKPCHPAHRRPGWAVIVARL